MGSCYMKKCTVVRPNAYEQLGIYPVGTDSRPTGDVTVLSNVTSLSSYVFQNDTAVTSVAFQGEVQSFATYCFSGCTALQTMELPNELAIIPDYCFQNCTALGSVKCGSETVQINQYAFTGCTFLSSVTFKNDDLTVNQYAFNGCTALQSIEFPQNFKSIPTYCFNGCTLLRKITIPASSVSIASYAFNNCSFITNDMFNEIGGKISSVSEYCFANMTGITDVTVRFIGGRMFSGCSNLKKVTVLGSTSDKQIKNYCIPSSVTTIILPDDSTTLNSYCFSGCTSLSSVNIPLACTTINDYAFQNCTSLTSIDIPENVVTIGSNAFSGCSNITEFHIDQPKNNITVPDNRWNSNSSAVIYWRTAVLTYTINIPKNSKLFIDGEEIGESPADVNVYDDTWNWVAYNPNYVPVSGVITGVEKDSSYSLDIEFTENETAATITVTANADGAIVTFKYDDFEYEGTNIVVPVGTELYYTIKASGYRTIKDSIIVSESKTISVEMEEVSYETVVLEYPFEDYSNRLTNLIDDSNFIINSSLSAITSGSTSYNVSNGTSYGYIVFVTPSDETTLSITCYVSSEGNYDYGGIYIDKSGYYQPTRAQISGKTLNDSSTGEWLYSSSGSQSSTTVTKTLDADSTYYLSFAYAKDGSANSNQDRFIITRIEFTAMEETE